MRGADIIGKKLADAGATTAFGIPGGEVLTLLDGLRAADIEFVLVKHENAGGFMAEGTWHASGAPAILVATIGPGVANCRLHGSFDLHLYLVDCHGGPD